MADEPVSAMPEQGEVYAVTIQVGHKASTFTITAPNDLSAIMAMTFVAAQSYPNVVAITIEHQATKRLVGFCPFMGILAKIAPLLNQLGAQGMVIPAAKVAPTEKGHDLTKMMEDARKAQSEKGAKGNDG